MNYAQAVSYLDSLTDFERLGFHRHFAETVSLDSAREFLRMLGDPHRAVPCVHIAGTKGKGSTAAILDSVLSAAGYRTGLFTSPHLVSLRERVRVGGEPIPEQALADCVELVQPAHESVRGNPDFQPCTFFEAYLGIAALHFLREKVDIAIYETGLGGRLDATNLVMPQVAAITTIGLDHTYILGETLDAIAREKAEISKPGVPLVVARNQQSEALGAIREVAAKNGAEAVLAPEVQRLEPPVKARIDDAGDPVPPMDRFQVRSALVATGEAVLDCPLIGAHQAWNVGVAVGVLEQLAARGYTVGGAELADGLRKVRWPGRFDLRGAKPWLVLDCAHNPDSARALATALREYLDFHRLALVVGMSGDKDIAGFAHELAALSPSVVLTRASNPRALPPAELQERATPTWDDAESADDPLEALDRAMRTVGESGAVCVTGSFYVVGEIMQRLSFH